MPDDTKRGSQALDEPAPSLSQEQVRALLVDGAQIAGQTRLILARLDALEAEVAALRTRPTLDSGLPTNAPTTTPPRSTSADAIPPALAEYLGMT
jgi:hypothetical protein